MERFQRVKEYVENSRTIDVTHIDRGVKTVVAAAAVRSTVEVEGPDQYQGDLPSGERIIVPYSGTESTETDQPREVGIATDVFRRDLPA